jgi:competence protein ComGC
VGLILLEIVMLMLLISLFFIKASAGFVRDGRKNILKLVKNQEKKLALYTFSSKGLEEL